MTLTHGWVPWLWVVAAVVTAAGCLLLRRRPTTDDVRIAHVERLRALPRYRTLVRRRRLAGACAAGTLVASLVAAGVLSARPVDYDVRRSPDKSRDIVLCLDVSGSMGAVDAGIAQRFVRIARGLRGDRISLVLFDGRAVTKVPLTDDAAYLESQLRVAAEALADLDFDYTVGTYDDHGGTSLVPDGLVSCLTRFDRLGEDRARSVVLATDDVVHGRTLFSMDEAVSLARRKGVRVYALDPSPAPTDAFIRQVRSTGGRHFSLAGGTSMVESLIRRITAEEARRTRSAPERIRHDRPRPAALLVVPVVLLGLVSLRWVRT